MTWLAYRKVLPPMLVGEPPSAPEILAAQREEPSVGWSIWWKERRLGWAVSQTRLLPQGLTEVRSRVHFDNFPLREMLPPALRGLVPPRDPLADLPPGEATSELVFDPLGGLSRFVCAIGFDPRQGVLKFEGAIDGPTMSLRVRYGESTSEEAKVRVPRNIMLRDALSPQSRLPGLREGQTWTVESYSPLQGHDTPTEILEVRVESRTRMVWNGQLEGTWLVVYRKDPGAVQSGDSPRGRLWVREDGTVLKQEVTLLGSTLTFVRLPDDQAAPLAGRLGVVP
jgi:hypothetical protein